MEDLSGVLWLIASIVCTALALSGYAALRRSVRAPKAVLVLGGALLWVFPMLASEVSIHSLQERPDQLLTLSNALWMLATVGGVAVIALAARPPRAVRQP